MNRTTCQCFKIACSARWATLLIGTLLSLVVGAFAGSGGSVTFAFTGSLNTARRDHTATLLQNGEVLLARGINFNSNLTTALASAELYNPTTGKWTLTGSMSDARTAF